MKICDECETVAHCTKHGCIPKVSAKDAMKLALDHLMNLQPILGNGLLEERQLAFIDPHIDCAIAALQGCLAEQPAPVKEPVEKMGTYEHKCPNVTGHRGPSFVCQKAGHGVGQNSYCNVCTCPEALNTSPQPAQQEPAKWMKPHPKCDGGCMYQCTKGYTQFPECATTPPPHHEPVKVCSLESLKLSMQESAWEGMIQLSDALENIDNFAAEQPAQQEPDLSGLKPSTQEVIKGWIEDGTFIQRAIWAMQEQEAENMRLEKMVEDQPAQAFVCSTGLCHMTLEELIDKAEEHVRVPTKSSLGYMGFEIDEDDFRRVFAALVRADERNSWPAEMEAMERQVNILTDALAQEREACAKVCVDIAATNKRSHADFEDAVAIPIQCAAAIRARGNT